MRAPMAAAPGATSCAPTTYLQQRGTPVQTQDFDRWLASARSRRGKQAFRAFETELHDGRWIWMAETTLAGG